MVKPAIVTTIDQRDTEQKAKVAAQGKFDKSQKDLAATNRVLNTTKQDLARTQGELKTARNSAEELKTTNTDLANRLKEATDKRDSLQAELTKWTQLQLTPEGVIKLEDDLKKAVAAVAARETENKLLNTKKRELEARLAEMVGTNHDIVEPPGLSGRVVAVDPKYGFVVLNIGNDKGVVNNGILLIARDGRLIGKVQIARVDQNQCVANILPAWRRDEVMEGDQALD